jgi:hypothetical protein
MSKIHANIIIRNYLKTPKQTRRKPSAIPHPMPVNRHLDCPLIGNPTRNTRHTEYMSKVVAIMRLVECDLSHLLQKVLRRAFARHKYQPRIYSRLFRPDVVPVRILCIELEVVRSRHLPRDHSMRRLCALAQEDGLEGLLFSRVHHGD